MVSKTQKIIKNYKPIMPMPLMAWLSPARIRGSRGGSRVSCDWVEGGRGLWGGGRGGIGWRGGAGRGVMGMVGCVGRRIGPGRQIGAWGTSKASGEGVGGRGMDTRGIGQDR